MTSGTAIVVIGGYGAVGRTVCAGLAERFRGGVLFSGDRSAKIGEATVSFPDAVE